MFQYSHRELRLPSKRTASLSNRPETFTWAPLRVFGSVTVEVGSNSTAAAVEDPQVVLGLLEEGLVAWADDWAATVLPGDKVTIDTEGTT